MQSVGSMLAVCGSVRKPPRGSLGRFIPFNKIGERGFKSVMRIENSDTVRKFSLNVSIIVDAISNAKQVSCRLT